MMRAALVGLSLLAASSAAAQTTQTTCNDYFGTLHCTSQTDRAPAAPAPRRDAFRESYDFATRSADASRQQRLRQRVGRLIADGKCDDARKVALKAGDLDLAERVPQLCNSE